jgi:hypothetical protein
MDNKQKFIKKILLTLICLSAITLIPNTYAATTTMDLNPATGSQSIGNKFSVDLIIDGHGEPFNAAKATVEVSSTLQINDLFLGDCNFSFITTPKTSNPSFTGAILGGSANQCTVYTLTLTPVSSGTGLITLSDASVKKYWNAEEILQSVQNATYTLTSTSDTPQQEDTTTHSTSTESSSQPPNQSTTIVPESDPGLTTLSLKVIDTKNKPVSGATIILTSTDNEVTTPPVQTNQIQTGSQSQTDLQTTTNKEGIANITNVPPGIHGIEVKNDDKQIANKIVNIPANETVMRLGIQEQKQAIGWIEITLTITAFLIAGGIIMIYFRNTLIQLSYKLVNRT